MSVSYDFDGQVAVVTGAAGALGGAVAEHFTMAGATVVAVDVVDPDDAEVPAGATYRQADLTEEETVAALFEAIAEEHGRIDTLANVAGTWRGGDPVHETDAGTFDLLMDVNLRTAFYAAKHALPHLRETGGAVVSVSARSGLSGGEGDALYRASKAGVKILTESIAEENLGSVRANCVLPSVIDTPMNRDMMPNADFSAWVEPAEIADVMLFLCSEGAVPTSGAAVPVYGEA
jgi:NAD(P)-dependent dehydrogenase (short-subunit alcohol dehydrogenase family)